MPRPETCPPQEQPSLSLDNLLTKTQLAARLGVSPWTIGYWCRRFALPVFRVAGRPRFDLQEVESWLQKRRDVTSYARHSGGAQ